MGKAARRKQVRPHQSVALGQEVRQGGGAAAVTALRPFGVAQALVMRARQAVGVGDTAAALTLFAEAVSRGASSPDVHNDLGVLLAQRGQLAAAVVQLEVAFALAPGGAGVRANLMKALEELALTALRGGRWQEAAMEYTRLTRMDPRQPVYQTHAGAALRELRHFDQALLHLQKAVALEPGSSSAHFNLGTLLLDMNRAECEGELALAVELDPRNFNAMVNLAAVQNRLGRLAQARATLTRALQLAPDHGEAHANLASILLEQGEIDASLEHFRRAQALRPRSAPIHASYLLARQTDPAASAAALRADHVAWADRFAAPLDPGLSGSHRPRDRDPDRRLRIGYQSADLRNHAVASFIAPLLAAHDPRQVAVYCYSDGEPDAVTERIRSRAQLAGWRDTRPLDDAALAQQIIDDEIDVLVDLSGHTRGNRLLVFARRPAPVQVTYCGYPGTTGLAAMGWRLTDAVADPGPADDEAHVEKLWRLPHGFLCFEPDPGLRAAEGTVRSTTSPALTFGSFNNFSKLSEQVLVTWAEVLKAVPGSRLLLKARASSDTGPRERIRDVFRRNGVDDGRIAFAPYASSAVDATRLYAEVDVALDPFPYNGTTTTCEALWMGVPVVTLSGQSHRARVGATLLERVDCRGLVAASIDDYVRIAAGLVTDGARLATLRAGLRARMAASSLTDAAVITRDLEDAYRQMWRLWCAAG